MSRRLPTFSKKTQEVRPLFRQTSSHFDNFLDVAASDVKAGGVGPASGALPRPLDRTPAPLAATAPPQLAADLSAAAPVDGWANPNMARTHGVPGSLSPIAAALTGTATATPPASAVAAPRSLSPVNQDLSANARVASAAEAAASIPTGLATNAAVTNRAQQIAGGMAVPGADPLDGLLTAEAVDAMVGVPAAEMAKLEIAAAEAQGRLPASASVNVPLASVPGSIAGPAMDARISPYAVAETAVPSANMAALQAAASAAAPVEQQALGTPLTSAPIGLTGAATLTSAAPDPVSAVAAQQAPLSVTPAGLAGAATLTSAAPSAIAEQQAPSGMNLIAGPAAPSSPVDDMASFADALRRSPEGFLSQKPALPSAITGVAPGPSPLGPTVSVEPGSPIGTGWGAMPAAAVTTTPASSMPSPTKAIGSAYSESFQSGPMGNFSVPGLLAGPSATSPNPGAMSLGSLVSTANNVPGVVSGIGGFLGNVAGQIAAAPSPTFSAPPIGKTAPLRTVAPPPAPAPAPAMPQLSPTSIPAAQPIDAMPQGALPGSLAPQLAAPTPDPMRGLGAPLGAKDAIGAGVGLLTGGPLGAIIGALGPRAIRSLVNAAQRGFLVALVAALAGSAVVLVEPSAASAASTGRATAARQGAAAANARAAEPRYRPRLRRALSLGMGSQTGKGGLNRRRSAGCMAHCCR